MGGRRRRGLADLIGEVGAASQGHGVDRHREAAPVEAQEGEHGSRTESGGEAAVSPTDRGEPVREEAEETAPPSRALPKYLRLERKEARLRGDQVDALSALARHVSRQKVSQGGERITENTLIRVAVDWLLSQEEYVGGSSEDEIRRSLGVPQIQHGNGGA